MLPYLCNFRFLKHQITFQRPQFIVKIKLLTIDYLFVALLQIRSIFLNTFHITVKWENHPYETTVALIMK